ncbi:MAG: thiamine pyrophosphate-dependent enzyme [Desulfitobacteriaceae bacterium]|nr:thiamine pyrophosphate-dependent enzyme [Desulfitobacteriaceae bacterium]
MSFLSLLVNEPGRQVLMSGNEAITRGAIEAGLSYAASYPGSPTAEIVTNLGRLAKTHELYAEWSVNEKVAIEEAAGASFTGLRSLCVVKHNGLNVALDSLVSISIGGVKAGMVLVVGDDPAAHSSTNEEDSRLISKVAHLPILEPSTPEEAKQMTLAAYALSERVQLPVTLRCVTRLSHGSGNVTLGLIQPANKKPVFKKEDRFVTHVAFHQAQEIKLAKIREAADTLPFNTYTGPEDAKTIIIASGPSSLYALEAVQALDLAGEVGVLKLGITWPLPEKFLLKHMKHAEKVIFIEEIEPFNEENVMALAAQHMTDIYPIQFFGQHSGHVAGPKGPGLGEMDPDIVKRSIARVIDTGVAEAAVATTNAVSAAGVPSAGIPEREMAFCAGCPHRASFWAMKSALALDGRNGVVLGDIGCYSLALRRTGWSLPQTMHAMGSGAGIANGLGKLDMFGFNQPVIAVVGDSTFFHATIPALINARYTSSNFMLVVLDNETTAMTGHQPHPGLNKNAMGEDVQGIAMEDVVRGLNIPVSIHDPYDVKGTVETVYKLLQSEGAKVLILRRVCALLAAKAETRPRVYVNQDQCIGDDCGCNRFCSTTFSCPATIWDPKKGKAVIDEVVCNRCQVCVSLCPQGAIKVEGGDQVAR